MAELALGSAHYKLSEASSSTTGPDYTTAVVTGLPGSDGKPALFPLGDWPSFQSAVATYFTPQGGTIPIANRFIDATIRVGGPMMRLPGGDLSLNLLAAQRRERIPDAKVDYLLFGTPLKLDVQQRTQSVRSAYAEVRAPLVPMASNHFLRGLELQLAARYDGLHARIPKGDNIFGEASDELVSIHRNALVFTIGAKTYPLPRLLLRGSFATGRLPPTLAQLQEVVNVLTPAATPDPRRGGRPVTSEGPVETVAGGSNDILQEIGRTLSIGAVLNPEGSGGPRLSIDYSRISTSREVFPYALSISTRAVVLAEDQYPGRVIRAPLTDEDRALGFTGGRIVRFDFRASNSGRRIVETVDLQLDWHIWDILGGELAPDAQATWLPSLRTRSAPDQPWIERSGYIDGPVRWRANGGATWTRGPSSVDLNLQYFHGYRVTSSEPADPDMDRQIVRFQGRERIPAQVYVDLAGRHRFDIAGAGPLRSIEVRLGILNLFDRSPPILADPDNIGYSAYGDPRLRRFELVVASKF